MDFKTGLGTAGDRLPGDSGGTGEKATVPVDLNSLSGTNLSAVTIKALKRYRERSQFPLCNAGVDAL